ncbi:sarcosine/dimethylglycine N-methyltransferase-like [Branchiostoma floridae x Branchiostoma belcheri]
MAEIKSMQLYSHVGRIYNELKELGYGDTDDLKVEDVSRFDSLHYHGVEAVDKAIQRFNIGADTRVLDVGSGIGGPARYLAWRTGCQVTALELQRDHHETGEVLTARCGLSERVKHVCGDVMDIDLGHGSYDLVTSWLVFCHIPDKKKVSERCLQHLKPGGNMLVEDLFALADLSEVSEDIGVNYFDLANLQDYKQQIADAGFVNVQVEDLTADWKDYVQDRLKTFISSEDRHVRVHGRPTYQALHGFYSSIVRLFTSGCVGGGRISATKPA